MNSYNVPIKEKTDTKRRNNGLMKEYIHGGDIYRHPDVLDYSANINPLGTPPGVIRAAKDSMERVCHYPDACQEKLKQALAEYEQVPVEWLICGNGAAELIFALVQAVKPKRALVLAPTFAEYAQALEAVGCEVNREILKKEDGFTLQDRILDRLQKEDLQMVFLCNPNNPTGILMNPKLLRQIVTLCEKRQIHLVVDECFLDFVPEPEVHTLKGELKGKKYLFLLKAFTKRYAMAGLRLGYGITSGETLMTQIEAQLQPWNVSTPGAGSRNCGAEGDSLCGEGENTDLSGTAIPAGGTDENGISGAGLPGKLSVL